MYRLLKCLGIVIALLLVVALVALQIYAHTSLEAYLWVYRLELYVGVGFIGLVFAILLGTACWDWVTNQLDKLKRRKR